MSQDEAKSKVSAVADENGATATEYALLLSTIALVILGMISVFGNALQNQWIQMVTTFQGF